MVLNMIDQQFFDEQNWVGMHWFLMQKQEFLLARLVPNRGQLPCVIKLHLINLFLSFRIQTMQHINMQRLSYLFNKIF